MKKQRQKKNEMVVFQAKNGAIQLKADTAHETIWATQVQIAETFNVDVRTVNEHIINIYKTNELARSSTIRKFRIVQKEGNREVGREVNHYNLDMILSVGYRVNSKNATLFRIWASNILKQHITQGFTINKAVIQNHHEIFLKAVEDIKAVLPTDGRIDAQSTLELVTLFANTWLSLSAYDQGDLPLKGATVKSVKMTAKDLHEAAQSFKQTLLEQGEATEIFAQERMRGSLEGIVGNVFQSFGGKAVYESVEEKAAHLLYFVVKNHPFVDGNKRTGAFAFVWFLKRAKILNTNEITPAALTALTLLVAESNPKEKEKIVGLIILLLRKK